jgi:hypothetical protein
MARPDNPETGRTALGLWWVTFSMTTNRMLSAHAGRLSMTHEKRSV